MKARRAAPLAFLLALNGIGLISLSADALN